MAIYHLSGTIISRSQGRSAVAAAAYRAADKLYDERYDKSQDYTQKKDVVFKEVLLPDGAPAWMKDRETLWNRVETVEKRKDAQLAREFNIALPRELSIEENISLARDFVMDTFVKRGMVADLCIHNDKGKEGEMQPHAHVMLTLREVLSDGFGQKVRAWNDKALLRDVREEWAVIANHHLALQGHDQTIDHRRLSEQAIPLEPQYKIGSRVAYSKLARLEDHLRIAQENGQRLLADPRIALDAITRQQSTFTEQDIARFVNRHTVDAEQFGVVYEKVKQCEGIVRLGLDEAGRERLTTRAMLKLESQMINKAVALSTVGSHDVRDYRRAEALEALHTLSNIQLSSEQKEAFHHVLDKEGLKCIKGFAGTGKSTLLGAARASWEKAGFQVVGVTLSGIAAENLQNGSGIPSRTLASRCHYWDKGEQTLTSRDVLVVDEAGMLSSRHMARIMDEVNRAGAKVVLVGDPQQLQAIEAGAAFRAIAERTQTVLLTEIKRQQVPWQQDATRLLARGKVDQAIEQYQAHEKIHAFETTDQAKVAMVEHWNETRLAHPSDTQLMLAYQRSDVLALNELARSYRAQQGELGNEAVFQTERGERLLAEGDRIYFLKNDRTLGVMNGSLGQIERIDGQMLTVALDRENHLRNKEKENVGLDKPERVCFTMERYSHIDYGYAATVHKAQGVTVDRSAVLASMYLDAHSSYVALSRHRETVDLFYGRDAFQSQKALIQTLQRDRPKDVTVDYVDRGREDFGERRGIQFADAPRREEKTRDRSDAFEEQRLMPQADFDDRHRVLERREKEERKEKNHSILNDRDNLLPLNSHQKEQLQAFTEAAHALRLSDSQRQKRQMRDAAFQKALDGLDKALDVPQQSFKADHRVEDNSISQDTLRVFDEKQSKKAIALIHEYEKLTDIIDKGGRSRALAETHLKTLVNQMTRQKEVMDYTQVHHPDIAKDIADKAKMITLEKSGSRGGREIDF